MSLLARVTEAYRTHVGVAQKAPISLVSDMYGRTDWLTGPGDDGALISPNGGQIVVGCEAMFPPFVAADPWGAGFAAVLANVNDLVAMGAIPLGILDTIVGPAPIAELVLGGMKEASTMYQVPIVGGHLTVHDGPASVSAFGIGEATAVLSVRNVRPGQAILLACSLDGTMRDDFPFFASFDARRDRMAGDVRIFAGLAASGGAVAAKDVSMAGLLGSLAMLLEARQAGAVVELDSIPVPNGVALEHWLISFPAYAFLLCTDLDRAEMCRAPFVDRGLTCEQIGVVTDDGVLEVASQGLSEVIVRFPDDHITGLTPL
ncbi:MAG TPA: AIR synthase related protein [Acidimicrobiia bacterium]|nr:AIR synthase related protein [Acidimicrobiia bacterium]